MPDEIGHPRWRDVLYFFCGLVVGIIPLVITEIATFGFYPFTLGANFTLFLLGGSLYFVALAFALMAAPYPRVRHGALGAIAALVASPVIYSISCQVQPHF